MVTRVILRPEIYYTQKWSGVLIWEERLKYPKFDKSLPIIDCGYPMALG